MEVEDESKTIDVQENFLDRQKNLNAQLDAIEKSLNKHVNHTDSRVPRLEDLSSSSQHRKIRGYRGRQSIFKRPEGPAPRTKVSVIPDYRKNPDKWTCYSMDNVSDMSNESNSQAAFAFLKELEQRREKDKKKHKLLELRDRRKLAEEEMEVDADGPNDAQTSGQLDDSPAVISFRKPAKRRESTNKPKPEIRSNKIVMPEYEFGTKKTTKKKNLKKSSTEKIDKSKEVKLDHLLDYDDEEE